jgi:hypothetical protein
MAAVWSGGSAILFLAACYVLSLGSRRARTYPLGTVRQGHDADMNPC